LRASVSTSVAWCLDKRHRGCHTLRLAPRGTVSAALPEGVGTGEKRVALFVDGRSERCARTATTRLLGVQDPPKFVLHLDPEVLGDWQRPGGLLT